MKLNVSVGAPPILSQSKATVRTYMTRKNFPCSRSSVYREFPPQTETYGNSVPLDYVFTGQNYHTLWKGFFNKDTSSNKSTENERELLLLLLPCCWCKVVSPLEAIGGIPELSYLRVLTKKYGYDISASSY